MPHITTCSDCGHCYEEASEEAAHTPTWTNRRLCGNCWNKLAGSQRDKAKAKLSEYFREAIEDEIVNELKKKEVR